MSSADGTARGKKPEPTKVGGAFARGGVKPRVASRRSVTEKKRGAVVSSANPKKAKPPEKFRGLFASAAAIPSCAAKIIVLQYY